jgi:hypothetical protein
MQKVPGRTLRGPLLQSRLFRSYAALVSVEARIHGAKPPVYRNNERSAACLRDPDAAPLERLLKACQTHPKGTSHEFEIIAKRGEGCSDKDARIEGHGGACGPEPARGSYCDVSVTAAGWLRFSFIEAASAVSLPCTVLAMVTASSRLPCP